MSNENSTNNDVREAKELGRYINPIIPGSNPDPSITRTNKGFFLITSSFDFFPGIPIYHSIDLIQWRLISHVLTRRSQLDIRAVEVGGGVWAPTIRYRSAEQEGRSEAEGGVFYVCGSTFDKYRPQADERIWPSGWYLKCSENDIWDCEGKGWSELTYFDMVGFDQDLFWDDDGQVYLSSTYRMRDRTPVPNGSKLLKDFAIHICLVDLNTGRSSKPPKMIRSSSSGVAEGSHIIKRGKYYYLFTAEGGTEAGHSEAVLRSEVGPLGPWELGEVLVKSGTSAIDEVQNTGHCDLIEDRNGNWWAVLLAVRPVKRGEVWDNSVFGRETFLIPVSWEDDWPVFNNRSQVKLTGNAPTLYAVPHDPTWRDDFLDPSMQMQLGWYRKSTPQRTDWSLSERIGYLRLWGGPYAPSTPASSTMWLRKQTYREVVFEARVDFCPESMHVEAGVIVWWNYTCLSSLGIRRSEEGRVVVYSGADGVRRTSSLKSSASEVILTVICGDQYEFLYHEVDEAAERRTVGSVSNAVMTRDPEVGAPFTGMMLGLYAYGELEASLAPADFAYAEMRIDNK